MTTELDRRRDQGDVPIPQASSLADDSAGPIAAARSIAAAAAAGDAAAPSDALDLTSAAASRPSSAEGAAQAASPGDRAGDTGAGRPAIVAPSEPAAGHSAPAAGDAWRSRTGLGIQTEGAPVGVPDAPFTGSADDVATSDVAAPVEPATSPSGGASGGQAAQGRPSAAGTGVAVSAEPAGAPPADPDVTAATGGGPAPASGDAEAANGETASTGGAVTAVCEAAPTGVSLAGSGIVPLYQSGVPSGMLDDPASTVYSPSAPFDADPAQVLAAVGGTGLAYTGAGITVGILSDSFDDLGGAAADEADGALPPAADVHVLEDLPSGGSDEGRAMAQIVHDVAPGADIDFYTADISEQDFANGILALAAAGCQVICDDVSYFDEPFFQTGVVAEAIQTVEQEGVIYVTCAANEGEEGYQSSWTPISHAVYDHTLLRDTQDFGGNTPVQTITIGAGAGLTPLILEWNQPYGQTTTDLGVLLFENGSLVGRFSNASVTGFVNAGDGANDPFIAIDLPPGTYQVAIENLSGPDPGVIQEQLFANGTEPIVSLGDANAGTVVGHHMSPDAITVGAVDAGNTPGTGNDAALQNEYYSSSGAGAQLWFNYDGTPVAGGPQDLNPVAVSGVDDIATTLPNDLADFFGTSAATPSIAGVVADMLQANPDLTSSQVDAILGESATPFGDPSVAGAGLVNATLAVEDAAACYCRGTMILTPDGEMPVEGLRIGDLVETQAGEKRPIRWIGHRAYDGRFIAGNRSILPICITAEALAEGVPTRDLWLSPSHSLYLDGALVLSEHLVNGATIVQAKAVERVEYFHVELDTHDVIFADGAPAESFVDCDNRRMFDNGAEYAALYPNDERPRWAFCQAPLGWNADELTEIREALWRRAEALGHTLETDPEPHLVVDGEIIRPDATAGEPYRFTVPAAHGAVWLASRSVVPVESVAASRDTRRLGVPVERLRLFDAGLSIEVHHCHPGLGEGFHADEPTLRWSDGMGRLPDAVVRLFGGAFTLDLHLVRSKLPYRMPILAAPIAGVRPLAA